MNILNKETRNYKKKIGVLDLEIERKNDKINELMTIIDEKEKLKKNLFQNKGEFLNLQKKLEESKKEKRNLQYELLSLNTERSIEKLEKTSSRNYEDLPKRDSILTRITKNEEIPSDLLSVNDKNLYTRPHENNFRIEINDNQIIQSVKFKIIIY